MELLIVLAVIGVLVTLALPSINAARESTRRSTCSANIRQAVLAIQHHSNTFRIYPSNGGYLADECLVETPYKSLETIGTDDFFFNSKSKWGVGRPSVRPDQQTGSWCYSVLPFLDQVPLYQSQNYGSRVSVFLCPSRSRGRPVVPVSDQHGNYYGAGRAWSKTDYAGNLLLFANRSFTEREGYVPTSEQSVIDGLSNTIYVGEKAFSNKVNVPTSWNWDEPIFSGGNYGTVRSGSKITDDTDDVFFRFNWGSPHTDVAHFGFGDGSTRSISKTISGEMLARLLSPALND